MIKILNKKFRRYTIPHLKTTFKLVNVFSEGETTTLQIWDDNCPSIQNINSRFPSVNFRPWLQNVALYWCRASFFTKTKTGCPCAFFFALRKHLCFKFLPPLLKSKLTCCYARHQKAMTYSWAIPCNGTYKVEL